MRFWIPNSRGFVRKNYREVDVREAVVVDVREVETEEAGAVAAAEEEDRKVRSFHSLFIVDVKRYHSLIQSCVSYFTQVLRVLPPP